MSWWVVFLLWLLLLILALALVALVGRQVYRQFRALLSELGEASRQLSAVSEGLGERPDDLDV